MDSVDTPKVLWDKRFRDIIEHMNEIELGSGGPAAGVMDASAVRAFHDRLDETIDTRDPWQELRALDELRNAISAREARLVVAAEEMQTRRDVPRRIESSETRRLTGARVGLARRCSLQKGSAFATVAHALVEDMPCTLAALAAGVLSEADAA